MPEELQPTIADIVSANQLQRVVDDAVAQANIGIAVIDPTGRVLSEGYGDADPCPDLAGTVIDSTRCPHGSAELAWLAETQGEAVEDRCPRGAFRRAYPLRYRDRVWGALITCSHDGAPRAVVDAVAALTVERLRDLIVAGFELQSLSREIVANYEQLTLLYGASVEVGAVHDVTSICERVLEQLHAQMPSEAAAVLLLSEETGRAQVSAARGDLLDVFRQPMPGMPDGVLCQVLATGEHAVVCDVPQGGSSETSSILCVPLMAGERLMGTVCARDKLSGEEYLAGDAKVVGAIGAQAATAISNAMLFGDVKTLFLGTVRSLASAVDAKDPYTLGHSQRVTQYAMVLARELGLPASEVEDLQLAALLHDVGKIGLPDEILLKAGKLTSEEWEQVRKHPIWGEEILRPIKQLRRVASWIRHEHERWNGSGYPDGLRGGAIPMPSRIIAVADAFDALTSDRSYRKAVSVDEAVDILQCAAGTEYDPEVIAVFLTAAESGKIDK